MDFIPLRATCPPRGHRVMVPTGVTNVFDELHEVSSRNGYLRVNGHPDTEVKIKRQTSETHLIDEIGRAHV